MAGKNKVSKEVAKLGSRLILARVLLGGGLVGLIMQLENHPASHPAARTEEVFEMLGEASDHYDFVETEILSALRKKIGLAALHSIDDGKSLTSEFTFHSAIPLRRADNRGNYCVWNSKTSDWDLEELVPKRMKLEGDNVMVIVKERSRTELPA